MREISYEKYSALANEIQTRLNRARELDECASEGYAMFYVHSQEDCLAMYAYISAIVISANHHMTWIYADRHSAYYKDQCKAYAFGTEFLRLANADSWIKRESEKPVWVRNKRS